MGVRTNFSRGGNVDISLKKDVMSLDLHKTRYPSYTTKKIPHESKRFVRICLNLYSGGVVFVFAKRTYFFVILYSFC